MKILQIVGTLAGGGVERLIDQLSPIINEQCSQCDVLTLSDEDAVYIESLRKNGIYVQVSPYRKRFDLRILFYIIKFVNNGKYDVVHAHTFPAFYWSAFASCFWNKNVKLVMTEHNTYNRRRDMYWLRPLERVVYSKYDTVISISRGTHSELLKWLNIKIRAKYIIVENGIDIDKFRYSIPLEKTDNKTDMCLLGVIGSFTKQKNHQLFIKSLPLLPENTYVLFAGEGILLGDCIELVKSLGLEKQVEFLGFRTDAERIMKTVDIVVIPSLWEGFGLIAAEAMASGKPIVASDVDGLRELVGNSGILFDPNNPEDIANKISFMINNKEKQLECIQNGALRVERYSVKTMGKKYLEIYSKLSERFYNE